MTDLVEKARQGRANALAGLGSNTGANPSSAGFGTRFRSSNRHEKVTFISTRARQQANGFLL